MLAPSHDKSVAWVQHSQASFGVRKLFECACILPSIRSMPIRSMPIRSMPIRSMPIRSMPTSKYPKPTYFESLTYFEPLTILSRSRMLSRSTKFTRSSRSNALQYIVISEAALSIRSLDAEAFVLKHLIFRCQHSFFECRSIRSLNAQSPPKSRRLL